MRGISLPTVLDAIRLVDSVIVWLGGVHWCECGGTVEREQTTGTGLGKRQLCRDRKVNRSCPVLSAQGQKEDVEKLRIGGCGCNSSCLC